MRPPTADPLDGVSWRIAGGVSMDSATVMLGDLATFLSWRATGACWSGETVLAEKLAFVETGGDWDCPVEKGAFGGEIVAVRVEFYSDAADLGGCWDAVGELTLDTPWCVVLDPASQVAPSAWEQLSRPSTEDLDVRAEGGMIIGSTLGVPTGRYLVEVFNHAEKDPLGVRLRKLGPNAASNKGDPASRVPGVAKPATARGSQVPPDGSSRRSTAPASLHLASGGEPEKSNQSWLCVTSCTGVAGWQCHS